MTFDENENSIALPSICSLVASFFCSLSFLSLSLSSFALNSLFALFLLTHFLCYQLYKDHLIGQKTRKNRTSRERISEGKNKNCSNTQTHTHTHTHRERERERERPEEKVEILPLLMDLEPFFVSHSLTYCLSLMKSLDEVESETKVTREMNSSEIKVFYALSIHFTFTWPTKFVSKFVCVCMYVCMYVCLCNIFTQNLLPLVHIK